MTLDEALSELASWIGRTGRDPDPERRAEWAAILLPHDDQAWAQRYLEAKGAAIPTSTCALVALRFLALCGCSCKEHSIPYAPRMGNAIADVQRVAQRHGAWRTSVLDLGAYPSPGDILAMRVGNPHVSVVTGSRAEDGAIPSVDGGQKDNTHTTARARTLFAPNDEIPFLIDLDDGVATSVGRKSVLYARVEIAAVLASLEKCS